MPRTALSELLSRIRTLCGAAFGSWLFRFLWSVLKRRLQLLRPITPQLWDRSHPPACPPSSGSFIAFATVPHDLFSADLAQSVNQTQYSHSSHPSESSTSTKVPEENPVEYDECPSSPSASLQTPHEEVTVNDIERTDRLKPVAARRLLPIRPDELLRYEANPKTPVTAAPGTFRVKPLQTDFSPKLSLPEGWTYHVQFEGQVFFYHEEKGIVTETWLYNPELCQEIMAFIQLIDEICEETQIQIPPTSELVLELRQDPETEENCCAYYFAHTERRIIFWLEEFDLDLVEVRGGQLPPQHMKLYFDSQYWTHFEYFEAIQVTSLTVLHELREIILNSFADTLTSRLSTVTQSEAQLTNLLKIVEGASRDLNAGGRGCPLAVGKIMSRFSHERFLNFYGQESPRLYRGQSIYNELSLADRRSWSMSIISPILFYIPDVHLYSMDKVWVDQMAARLPWVKFIENLISEWKEHTTFATILLTVNISFLDVPGVESEGPSQSLTQVFSSISLVLCAASAILGLILVRQQRTKRIGTADEAVEFFSNNHLEISAIIYSLPHALLLHGMGFFLLAFMLSCFLWTSTTTRLMVGIFCALACILVLWCIVWQACEESMTVVPSWLNRIFSTLEPDRGETGEVNTNHEDAVAQIEKGFSSESLQNTPEIV